MFVRNASYLYWACLWERGILVRGIRGDCVINSWCMLLNWQSHPPFQSLPVASSPQSMYGVIPEESQQWGDIRRDRRKNIKVWKLISIKKPSWTYRMTIIGILTAVKSRTITTIQTNPYTRLAHRKPKTKALYTDRRTDGRTYAPIDSFRRSK